MAETKTNSTRKTKPATATKRKAKPATATKREAKPATATKRKTNPAAAATRKTKPANAPKRKTASTNGTSKRQRQRVRHADAARAKVEARRERQEGAAGWVADRAGEWSLDGPDWDFFERQKYLWNPLVDFWFRMEVEGWENLPDPPALLVGIHSGAPFVWDAWTVGVHWWRQFGRSRPLHGTAHDALMALPLIGAYFRRMGVLPAAPDSMAAALAAGHDVALWPGGERDSLRTWRRRDEAVLAGRTGFVRLAIRSGVPVVPIATVGGADAMPVLASGRRLAQILQLDRIARLKVFPIAFQLPWGVSPAVLPEVPLPTKIRTSFEPPVKLESDPKRADDERYVERKYDEIQARIQAGMDRLARRRRLPLFG